MTQRRLESLRRLAHLQLPEVGSRQPDPGDRVDSRSALARLPKRQRAAVVLRFIYGMSVEDTAASAA